MKDLELLLALTERGRDGEQLDEAGQIALRNAIIGIKALLGHEEKLDTLLSTMAATNKVFEHGLVIPNIDDSPTVVSGFILMFISTLAQLIKQPDPRRMAIMTGVSNVYLQAISEKLKSVDENDTTEMFKNIVTLMDTSPKELAEASEMAAAYTEQLEEKNAEIAGLKQEIDDLKKKRKLDDVSQGGASQGGGSFDEEAEESLPTPEHMPNFPMDDVNGGHD